jgi:hypothetical protein
LFSTVFAFTGFPLLSLAEKRNKRKDDRPKTRTLKKNLNNLLNMPKKKEKIKHNTIPSILPPPSEGARGRKNF